MTATRLWTLDSLDDFVVPGGLVPIESGASQISAKPTAAGRRNECAPGPLMLRAMIHQSLGQTSLTHSLESESAGRLQGSRQFKALLCFGHLWTFGCFWYEKVVLQLKCQPSLENTQTQTQLQFPLLSHGKKCVDSDRLDIHGYSKQRPPTTQAAEQSLNG